MYNYIVSTSNFIALPMMYLSDSPYRYFMLLPLLGSFLYHMAEKRHHLPGIYPFNNYQDELLFFDRLCAFLSGLIIVRFMIFNPITPEFIVVNIITWLSGIMSEKDMIHDYLLKQEHHMARYFATSHLEFTISHCIWHFGAFYLLWMSL